MNGSSHWNEDYEKGLHLTRWEYPVPSSELVAVIAATGVPQEGVSLDVGCGTGREAIFLAQCGFRSIGIDWSPQALLLAQENAREAKVKVDFREASVLDLPLADASVDFVNDRGCFHHVDEKDRPRYASQIHRVLVKDGIVLIRGCRDPNDPRPFVRVFQEDIDRHFAPLFLRGPVLPMLSMANGGGLPVNVVVLRKR